MTSSPAVSNILIAPPTSPSPTNASKRPVADESRTHDFQKTWQDMRSDQNAAAADRSKRSADARDRNDASSRNTSSKNNRDEKIDLKAKQAIDRKENNHADRSNAQTQAQTRQAQVKRDDIAAERSIRAEDKSDDVRKSRKANDTDTKHSNQKLTKKNDTAEVTDNVSGDTGIQKDGAVDTKNEKSLSPESTEVVGLAALVVAGEATTANSIAISGFEAADTTAGDAATLSAKDPSLDSAIALVSALPSEATVQTGFLNGAATIQSVSDAILSTTGQAANTSATFTKTASAPIPGVATSGAKVLTSFPAAISEAADLLDASANTLIGKGVDASAIAKTSENIAAGDTSVMDAKSAFEKMLQTVATAANTSNSGSGNQSSDSNAEVSAAHTGASSTTAAESFARTMETPAARSFVVQTAVPVNVGQPQWSQAVGDKVLWLAAQNVTSAEISLNPLDLGPMNVKVSVNQDQATVNFTSHHPIVREVLDQNLGRLRDMFAEHGLHLNVDVSDRSFNRQQGEGKDQNGQPGGNTNAIEEDAPVAVSSIIQQRLVDHYA